jgi:hypothetical protein
VINTLISRSPSGSNCFGAIIDGGHNISSDASCHFTAPGSLNDTDPLLGPLADYGGPTPTMALLAGSPAIDAADPAACPPTDQRGRPRPFGAGCDIGAFESSSPYTILGQVTGYNTPPSGILVSAGATSAWTDAGGNYALHGFSAGSYTVTPASPEAVFILSNRVVNLGPDAVYVNFHSYRSNALTIERLSGEVCRNVFAGEAGDTWRVLTATDLLNWSEYSVKTVEPSGIFDFFHTNGVGSGTKFFQAVKP